MWLYSSFVVNSKIIEIVDVPDLYAWLVSSAAVYADNGAWILEMPHTRATSACARKDTFPNFCDRASYRRVDSVIEFIAGNHREQKFCTY